MLVLPKRRLGCIYEIRARAVRSELLSHKYNGLRHRTWKERRRTPVWTSPRCFLAPPKASNRPGMLKQLSVGTPRSLDRFDCFVICGGHFLTSPLDEILSNYNQVHATHSFFLSELWFGRKRLTVARWHLTFTPWLNDLFSFQSIFSFLCERKSAPIYMPDEILGRCTRVCRRAWGL